MKKGFTLVELLAAIVVLSIIISIVITTVSNIMDTSKKKAAEATAYAIIRTSALYSLDNNYFGTMDVLDPRLEYDGQKPDAGSVQTNEDSETKIAILLNGWCVTKDYGSDEVTSIKTETCNMP